MFSKRVSFWLRNSSSWNILAEARRGLYQKQSDEKSIDSNSEQHLEIERKFWYNFDLERRLVDLGARQLEPAREIRDEYFDNTESYFMLFNDYLLRLRQKSGQTSGKWQLKYPSSVTTRQADSTIENYLEVNEQSQIIESICHLACRDRTHQTFPKNMKEMINEFDLKCFAPINSTRKSFIIDESGLRVDLDETDFGYRLGEIELVLDQKTSTSKDLDRAKGKITDLTSKLGINSFQGIPGKISTYLYLFNRPLLDLLVRKSIVSQLVAENLKKIKTIK